MLAVSDTPKARTLWPLPGGAGTYLSTLRRMLRMVVETTDRDAVVSRVVGEFGLTSAKTARSYLQVLHTLGFIESVGASVYLTEEGRREVARPDDARIRRALMQRIAGCSELVAILRKRPMRMAGACEAMRAHGFDWTTQAQVRHRLRWLEEVGDVERLGRARPEYRLTTAGTRRR